MFIGIVEHLEHTSAGNIAHYFRLPLIWKLGKFFLRFVKAIQQISIMLSNQCFKQLFLAFVVAIKAPVVMPTDLTIFRREASLKPFSKNSAFAA